MLIPSRRHTQRDLEVWEREMRVAAVHATLRAFRCNVARSQAALMSFSSSGRGYVGVSWGKDSTVVADMAARLCPEWPLVWVRVEPIANPDCALVRDEFLSRYPGARYDEIVVWCRKDRDGWHASGTLEHGFSVAAQRYGERYISGIRAQESGIRKLRVAKHGLVTANTCAPLGWWTAQDIWAYMLTRDLPAHPAYACTMNGAYEPGRIRVSSLGGQRGTGRGRHEWERHYYSQELMRIERTESPGDTGSGARP